MNKPVRKGIKTGRQLNVEKVLSKDPTVEGQTFEYRKQWTVDEAANVDHIVNGFLGTVYKLCEMDKKYAHWIQTAKQKEIAVDFGVSQASISRAFGTLQKEYKNKRNEMIIEMVEDENNTNGYVAEYFGVTEGTVRNIVNKSREDLDDSQKYTGQNKITNGKKPLAEEGKTQYELKLDEVKHKLSEEKKRNQNIRIELRNCKALINAKDEKIAELLMEITALKMSQDE